MGALNEAFNFFHNWLWGTAPISAFAPYAESITIFISLFLVCGMLWFCFRLVTSVIRIVFDFFRR